MYTMMNLHTNIEIASQRHQVRLATAERSRLRRRFTFRAARPAVGPQPTGGRVIPFSATSAVSTVSASPAANADNSATTISAEPAVAGKQLEHASARVA